MEGDSGLLLGPDAILRVAHTALALTERQTPISSTYSRLCSPLAINICDTLLMVQVDVPTFSCIPGSTQSPFHSIASRSVAHASTSPAPPSGHLRPQSTLPPLPRSSPGPPSAFPFVHRRPQATLPGPSQAIASLYPTGRLSRRPTLPPLRGSTYRIGQPHPQSTSPLPAFPQRPAPTAAPRSQSTLPPFPTPISYETQPPVPFHSSGAGPADRLTQWPGPAAGSPPTIRVTVTEDETMPVSGPYHASDHRLPLGSLPDLHRAGQTAAVSSVSILNPNETPISRVSNPGHASDSRILRSMPNLRRVGQTTPAGSDSQASAPSLASTTLRELQGFPVAHRLTTFAQDLFVDAIYQQERGGWKDFDDVPTVTRLSGEMSLEVSDSQSRKQSGLPEAKREKVEAGSLLSFATRNQLADSPLVFDPSSAYTRSLVSLSFDKAHWI